MYVQGIYDLEKYFLVARYGMFTPDSDSGEVDLTRISLGDGLIIVEGAELRIEHQMNTESETEVDNNTTYFQLVDCQVLNVV